VWWSVRIEWHPRGICASEVPRQRIVETIPASDSAIDPGIASTAEHADHDTAPNPVIEARKRTFRSQSDWIELDHDPISGFSA
jgi:hypothetical protein